MKPSGSFQSRRSTKEFKNAQPTMGSRQGRDIHGEDSRIEAAPVLYLSKAGLPNREQRYGSLF